MASVPYIVLTAALIGLPIGCIANWWSSWRMHTQGLPLVPYQSRNCVGWGLLDMGLYVIVLAAMVGLGIKLATNHLGIENASDTSALTPGEQSTIFIAFGLSVLIATALSLGWNWSRFQSLDGFDAAKIRSDIELGIRWFLMLIVPVLLVQLLLSRWFPSHHPLVDMLQESGDTSFLLTAAFAAVISAPIFEECFFRLFLQGWLEKLQITRERTALGLTSKADRDAVLLGGATSGAVPNQTGPALDSSAERNEVTGSPTDNPYLAPSELDKQADSATCPERRTMWSPILVTSGIFSIAHLQHGPDWIPLFFLAIGLGYLYQRTGRILPSMVVHFLVNSLGILQLWATVNQP